MASRRRGGPVALEERLNVRSDGAFANTAGSTTWVLVFRRLEQGGAANHAEHWSTWSRYQCRAPWL